MTSHRTRRPVARIVLAIVLATAMISWSRNPSLEEQVKADEQSEWGINHMEVQN